MTIILNLLSYWVIDKENKFWMSDGHGDCLQPTNQDSLLSMASDDEDALNHIKNTLGIAINKEKELKQQRDKLYMELFSIREIFKVAIANHKKGKDKPQIPTLLFPSVSPSTIHEMEWWVKRWDQILNIPEFEGLK